MPCGKEVDAMPYSHSFSSDFYGDIYDPGEPTSRPVTVAQAIISMRELDRDYWNRMAEELFGVPGEHLPEDVVFERILETDTVSGLTPPVEVWVDGEGYYTLLVWEAWDGQD